MPINYSLPAYLEPPNEEQRQTMELQADAARARNALMLRKQIGVTLAQKQYQGLVSNGVDPVTAQRQSLLDNAQYLFADNPQALVNLHKSDEADAIKMQAQAQLRTYHDRAQTQLDTKEKDLNESRAANLLLKQEGIIGKWHYDALEARHKAAQDELAKLKEEATKKHEAAMEAIGTGGLAVKKATEARKAREEVARDPQIIALDEQIGAAEKDLAGVLGGTKFWNAFRGTPEAKRKAIEELKAARAKRVGELTGKSTPEPAAAPAAAADKVIVRDKAGKRYRLPKSQLDEALKSGYTQEQE